MKIADDTRDFLQDAQNQDVVKLLTGNFNTLINVFQKLDKTRDGFVIGSGGEPEIVNSRIYQNVLIVDRLFGAAELRLGSGNRQQTVRIVRVQPGQTAATGQTTATGGAPS